MRAVLRFYAELRDLLPSQQQSGTVVREFDVPGSVKDAIEACGVPHTEVELILANGEPVDFSYRLGNEDRISVYPMFEAFEIPTGLRVRRDALRRVRFVLDGHLGRLSRYLRLLGFDTLCDNTWSDHELVAISTQQHRILLTRDVGLLKHRAITHGCCVRSTDPLQQLVGVVRRLHLSDRIRPFTRCMKCNGVLAAVEKGDVAHRLPPGTRDRVDDYWMCVECRKIYWRGSHARRLDEIVRTARRAGI